MPNLAEHFTESELQATEHPREPRRDRRITSAFRVEVCGFNRCGRFFTERTLTSNISDGAVRSRCKSKSRKIQSGLCGSSNTETAANSTSAPRCSKSKEWSRKHLVGRWACQSCSERRCGALKPRQQPFSNRLPDPLGIYLRRGPWLPPASCIRGFEVVSYAIFTVSQEKRWQRPNYLLYLRTVSAGDTGHSDSPWAFLREC
jgi:hypothetical protein